MKEFIEIEKIKEIVAKVIIICLTSLIVLAVVKWLVYKEEKLIEWDSILSIIINIILISIGILVLISTFILVRYRKDKF